MAIADLAPGQHADHVRNHWWWRPGWRAGRRFYALHITFQDQHDLYRRADAYRSALTGLDVTLVPDNWLHLTMQGIGFTDEVSQSTIVNIGDEVAAVLSSIPSIEVAFREIVVGDEAIAMPTTPAEPVRHLRTSVRQALQRVLGENQVPEDPHRYRPHVSIAYITRGADSQPYIRAVGNARVEPVTIHIDHVDLIEVHRDHRMYEWTIIRPLRLRLT